MIDTLHVGFLKEKIEDIRSALLFSDSKAVLRLPNCLVSAFQVDELGNIWLLAPLPKQQLREFEQRFPVQLNFYRKGKTFYLNIKGEANIILEPSELDEMLHCINAQKDFLKKYIFLKVRIADTHYHETSTATKNHWLSNVYSQMNKWILGNIPGYATYNA